MVGLLFVAGLCVLLFCFCVVGYIVGLGFVIAFWVGFWFTLRLCSGYLIVVVSSH